MYTRALKGPATMKKIILLAAAVVLATVILLASSALAQDELPQWGSGDLCGFTAAVSSRSRDDAFKQRLATEVRRARTAVCLGQLPPACDLLCTVNWSDHDSNRPLRLAVSWAGERFVVHSRRAV
ncbi:hypothetical protein L0Y34_01525 [Candidatus Parcubacteria bacterium]|nr:hypothetical protein [Candidatus Parcubacteria bacterium]